MGLDVYSSADKKMQHCLVSLSDYDICMLEEGISLLREKTGIYLDPYGTTKLYPDHGKILLNFIIKNKKNTKNIVDLLNVIQDHIMKNEILIFEGD